MDTLSPVTTDINKYIWTLELLECDLRGRRIADRDADTLIRKLGTLIDTANAAKVHTPPPSPPPIRILKEGSLGICDKCGSSLKKTWFGKTLGCVQQKCSNYYN